MEKKLYAPMEPVNHTSWPALSGANWIILNHFKLSHYHSLVLFPG